MDPLKRPTSSEIKNIIENWYKNIKNLNFDKSLKNDIIDFYKADKVLEQQQDDITINNKLTTKSNSQVYYTSRLLDFTERINEVLDYDNQQTDSIGNYFKFLNLLIFVNLII